MAIPATALHLRSRSWSTRFERGLRQIAPGLGVPTRATLTATQQKLLIYEPGQFFAPHRDSEKEPDTMGTLVIVLPGNYTGGEVVVCHAGEEITFATSAEGRANRLSFLGFYADCLHKRDRFGRGTGSVSRTRFRQPRPPSLLLRRSGPNGALG